MSKVKEKLADIVCDAMENGCIGHCNYPPCFAVEQVVDSLIAQGVVMLPCKEGGTVYRIKKFCEENTGYSEFYRPSKEFPRDCQHYEPAEWECEESCKIGSDSSYCSLYLDIHCEICKERIAVQADKFEFSMMRRVFNTPMFDENTELRDTLFLTKEDAEQALKDLLSKSEPPKGD